MELSTSSSRYLPDRNAWVNNPVQVVLDQEPDDHHDHDHDHDHGNGGCCGSPVQTESVPCCSPDDHDETINANPKPHVHSHPHAHAHSHTHDGTDQNCGRDGRGGQDRPRSLDSHSHTCCDTSCCGTICCSESGICPRKSRYGTEENLMELGPDEMERVVLNVKGMTCSHCEGQLKLALVTNPAVDKSTVKTSILLRRAEFSINTGRATVQSVIDRIGAVTAFKCTQIFEDGGQFVDVVVPDPAEHGGVVIVDPDSPPSGILDIVILTGRSGKAKGRQAIARLFYDAQKIGVRHLLEKSFPAPLSLAPVRAAEADETGKRVVTRLQIVTFIAAVLTVPVLVFAWGHFPSDFNTQLRYDSISLALAFGVQIIAVIEFYPPAFRSLVYARTVEMDMLVVLSTTVAFVFSLVAYAKFVTHHPLESGQFFETSTLLVTLVLVGRLLNEIARGKATNLVSVRSLQTAHAELVVESPGGSTASRIDVRLLQYNDVIRIPAFARVVTDGIVISGKSEMDESMITGEALPVPKSTGSHIIAGAMNGPGELLVRVIRLPSENTISQIAHLVDQAKLEKPRIQKLADTVAGWMVPVIFFIAIIVFVAQLVVRMKRNGQTGSAAAAAAVTYAVATLIISCPCAIGLAVPMVVVIATGVSAKLGVIFKDPQAIECARSVKHVVFDKTGTLTQSRMEVAAEHFVSRDWPALVPEPDRAVIRAKILGLLQGDSHPVARAVVAHLKQVGDSPSPSFPPSPITPFPLEDIRSEPGKGVIGWQDSSVKDRGIIVAGNARWLQREDHPDVIDIQKQHMTSLCVMIDGYLAAVYGLRNPIRDNAPSVIRSLQAAGITVHLVSGDNDGVVNQVGRHLGILPQHTRAKTSPAEKQEYVRKLVNPTPASASPVLFCGDGTNDAPALQSATIGVHMPPDASPSDNQSDGGSAGGIANADAAAASADVVLLTPDLAKITTLISVSKSAFWRIRLNFIWAAIYNIIAILATSGAFQAAAHGWRIPPAFAAVGEVVSVAPVILIAMSLYFSSF